MRGEIKRLHQDIATTMIYVTHDQIEAMTLADRIVLMRDGVIEQQGAPLELFERPATRFVASFLGSPKMNFLSGVLKRAPDGDAIQVGGNGPSLPLRARSSTDGAADGTPVVLGIRPEHMARAAGPTPPEGFVRLDTTIELLQPTGSRTYATFRLGGEPVVAELEAHDVSRPGEAISLDINVARASLFDAATERALPRA
jgi:multiple sugar transport system ATP-binding protein